MRTSNKRFRVLGLLGLPLLAMAVMALVLAWGQSTSSPASAVGQPLDGSDTALSVKAGSTTCPPNKPTADFCVGNGQTFTLGVEIVAPPAGGYILFQDYIQFSDNLTYKKQPAADEIIHPGAAGFQLGGQHDNQLPAGTDAVNHGLSTGIIPPFPISVFVGNAVEIDLNCPAGLGKKPVIITLLPSGDPVAGTDGGLYVRPDGSQVISKGHEIEVNCVPAPTNTPTPTPPPIPRWVKAACPAPPADPTKCDEKKNPSNPAHLDNLFLEDDPNPNGKLTRCEDGTDVAVFHEMLTKSIVSQDPKGSGAFQKLGAFSFEVRFDPKLLCINLETSPDMPAGWTCFIDDKDEGLELQGIARMGCVSKGKATLPWPNQVDSNGDPSGGGPLLAILEVRPQPELYTQLKANQDNGIVAQLLDQDCKLGDDQGHPIEIFSCEDAELTIRRLEGDVAGDCAVDALDQQVIAFRWGATKGSLVYNSRYDLEPSGFPTGGLNGDGDIDIKDIQFVFGRHGSLCTQQNREGFSGPSWPAQLPVQKY